MNDVEQDLREARADLEHTIKDFDRAQQLIDQQQKDLKELREPFDAQVKRIDQQLEAILNQQHGLTETGPQISVPKPPREMGPTEAAVWQREHGTEAIERSDPVSKQQIDDLLKTLTRPKVEPTLKPPGGIVPDSIATIDRDMKIIAKSREKQVRLDSASDSLKQNWKQSRGISR